MDYLKLLEHSFEVEKGLDQCAPQSRLAYLAESVFNFITYETEIDELFATKAIEVCAAINNRSTFDYIDDTENRKWYLIMCNMPFFSDKITWGSSIRGAWWAGKQSNNQIEIKYCWFWIDGRQCADTMKFSEEEWQKFITAVIEFALVK